MSPRPAPAPPFHARCPHWEQGARPTAVLQSDVRDTHGRLLRLLLACCRSELAQEAGCPVTKVGSDAFSVDMPAATQALRQLHTQALVRDRFPPTGERSAAIILATPPNLAPRIPLQVAACGEGPLLVSLVAVLSMYTFRTLEVGALSQVRHHMRPLVLRAGVRIFNLLVARRQLEQKQVAEGAMVTVRDAREMLYRLLRAGFVALQVSVIRLSARTAHGQLQSV